MSKIHVMDEGLSNKIAAGEVVESVMNVVKELVENAIDAEANDISIKLVESGIKEIEVRDNGIGMDKDDARLAFSRHATSKIKDLDDLFYIESLGFRGEALPSIASVSKVRLKTSNGEVGTIITINGGKDLKAKSSDLALGTDITVTELFYNTPVRLKYLKNPYIELANVVEYVDKMALSYPDIKFKLVNDDNTILETSGNGDLLKVIYDIYGADITRKMIPIDAENDDYNISGYISYPEVTKSNRNAITTLVNGRVIKNNELNRCIVDAYHTYIHKGRYPIIVLNIDVDPILVDINIHPTKMDIKFSKMDTLVDLVSKTIGDRLKTLTLIPEANVRSTSSFNEVYDQITHDEEDEEEVVEEKNTTNYEEVKLDFDIEEEKKEYSKTTRIKKMDVVGNIFMTYILCQNEDGFYLVDQHAAAERINYEKILDRINNEKLQVIDLLTPIKIELTPNDYIKVVNKLDILKDMGINVEEFGDNTFVVRSHPMWIDTDRSEASIRDIFDIIVEHGDFSEEKFIDTVVMTIACHSSVKAHEYVSIDDMQWIVDNVRYCNNPFTCPHGRPTIITYTKEELDKMFKRDYNE
ncbi:MAG: DNA mismatch repair endonuclease MutL [Bacilli bacterium]|nr:DNA mismatch repair endonuclease MutL [Bacilli bacterium]